MQDHPPFWVVWYIDDFHERFKVWRAAAMWFLGIRKQIAMYGMGMGDILACKRRKIADGIQVVAVRWK